MWALAGAGFAPHAVEGGAAVGDVDGGGDGEAVVEEEGEVAAVGGFEVGGDATAVEFGEAVGQERRADALALVGGQDREEVQVVVGAVDGVVGLQRGVHGEEAGHVGAGGRDQPGVVVGGADVGDAVGGGIPDRDTAA